MPKQFADNLKEKIEQFIAAIQQEGRAKSPDLKEEIDRITSSLKSAFEENLGKFAGENVQQFVKDTEEWALNVRNNIEQKLADNMPHRDEIINTVSDSLIEFINKVRTMFTSK